MTEEAIGRIRDVVIDIKGQEEEDYPRVFLADTDEEIREIPIRFDAVIRCARPGQRISFSRHVLKDGPLKDERPFLDGDGCVMERLRATVRTTEPEYPASRRMLDAARAAL